MKDILKLSLTARNILRAAGRALAKSYKGGSAADKTVFLSVIAAMKADGLAVTAVADRGTWKVLTDPIRAAVTGTEGSKASVLSVVKGVLTSTDAAIAVPVTALWNAVLVTDGAITCDLYGTRSAAEEGGPIRNLRTLYGLRKQKPRAGKTIAGVTDDAAGATKVLVACAEYGPEFHAVLRAGGVTVPAAEPAGAII